MHYGIKQIQTTLSLLMQKFNDTAIQSVLC